MNEQELIKAAQNGDFKAFSTLIEEHKDKIYRLALKLTDNRQDAEDVLQETFLKAIDNIDKFRMDSSFGTWLYSIALNHFRTGAVKDKQMDLRPIEEYLPDSNSDGISNLFDWGDPHDHLEKKQIMQIIESGLAEMKYIYSAPFILRYMEDMPVKEISEILKLSMPATKSRILRARLELRDRLSLGFQEK